MITSTNEAIYGQSTDTAGTGVYGWASATIGITVGVSGLSDSTTNGIGVLGYGGMYGGSGTSYGVFGGSHSSYGYGVYGINHSNGSYGHLASGNDCDISNTGAYGYSKSNTGVYGCSCYYKANCSSGFLESASIGVQGFSYDGVGVYGHSTGDVGVKARSFSGNPIEAYGSNDTDRKFYVSNSGEVYADGSFHSGGADLAEMLPAVADLEPGDVLAIGLNGNLVHATESYQASVVGVYSTQPGFIGGSSDDSDLTGKIPLAVVGIVPVKASAENGPIRPGDSLTTSNTPGHAMRADAITLSGITFYPSGVIIGKALEGLEEGTGVIQILVMLQ